MEPPILYNGGSYYNLGEAGIYMWNKIPNNTRPELYINSDGILVIPKELAGFIVPSAYYVIIQFDPETRQIAISPADQGPGQQSMELYPTELTDKFIKIDLYYQLGDIDLKSGYRVALKDPTVNQMNGIIKATVPRYVYPEPIS